MTDKTDTQAPDGFDADPGIKDIALPHTAEGVGSLLERVAEFVEDRTFAQPGVMADPEGRFVPMLLKPDGNVEFVGHRQFDAYAANPLFRRGTATFTSLDSFIAHVNRFGDADSAVFADDSRAAPSVTAVLDYHRADTLATEDGGAASDRVHGEYRHGRHRAFHTFPLSDEWKAWQNQNAETMSMSDFAHFLEDRVLDVAEIDKVPETAKRFVEMHGGTGMIADWAKLTKLAKSLTVFENAVARQVTNLASGEGEIMLAADHNTEIEGVPVKVPTMFFISIPIFKRGAHYRIPVRLRYRKSGAGVVFWYELWRADVAFDDALTEAVSRVGAETEAAVFYGSPESE